jgi:hypothetical protein
MFGCVANPKTQDMYMYAGCYLHALHLLAVAVLPRTVELQTVRLMSLTCQMKGGGMYCC